jgi:hypothetical protein
MTGPRSASPLASSGADWTGADIGDLHDLAATLHGYLPGIAGVAATLNQEVAQLTAGDQSWRGPVASAFTAAWQRDAVAVEVLAQVVTWTGDVVGDLALDLAAIEQRLGEAASGQYRGSTYRLACDQAMADARQASERAAARLSDLYAGCTAVRDPAARQVAGDPAGSIAGVGGGRGQRPGRPRTLRMGTPRICWTACSETATAGIITAPLPEPGTVSRTVSRSVSKV